MSDRERRYGHIHIDDLTVERRPWEAFEVFKMVGFLPVDIDRKLEFREYHFFGWSDEFAVLSRGCIAPVYQVEITKDKKGKIVSARILKR